jgi:hypothetical protein
MGSFLTSNPGPELNFLTKEERKKVFPAGYCPMLEMRDRLSLPDNDTPLYAGKPGYGPRW